MYNMNIPRLMLTALVLLLSCSTFANDETAIMYQRLGLMNGDMITHVNGRPIENPGQFLKSLNGLPNEIRIMRNGKEIHLVYDDRQSSQGAAARAGCNMQLARASGIYLTELEKAKLYDFQSGGACKVLNDEFKKCNETQKSTLGKAFDVRQVFGNICMPHLSPPTS